MIAVMKEICIFMLIAQAVLYFVPGTSYVKYVRVLVGIMLILRIAEPLFGLFLEEEEKLILEERIKEIQEEIRKSQPQIEIQDNSADIWQGVEKELLYKLNQAKNNYYVTDVRLTYDQEENRLIVTVVPRPQSEEGEIRVSIEPINLAVKEENSGSENDEFGELKEQYAALTGLKEEEIKIVSGMD